MARTRMDASAHCRCARGFLSVATSHPGPRDRAPRPFPVLRLAWHRSSRCRCRRPPERGPSDVLGEQFRQRAYVAATQRGGSAANSSRRNPVSFRVSVAVPDVRNSVGSSCIVTSRAVRGGPGISIGCSFNSVGSACRSAGFTAASRCEGRSVCKVGNRLWYVAGRSLCGISSPHVIRRRSLARFR
jgi:hypothetical protein